MPTNIKRKYKVAEEAADTWLLRWTKRLIDSPYTLAIVACVCAAVLAWRFL